MAWKLPYPVAYSVRCEASWLLMPFVYNWRLYCPISRIWELYESPSVFDRKQERGEGHHLPMQSQMQSRGLRCSEENKQAWKFPPGTDETTSVQTCYDQHPTLMCLWAAFAWRLSNLWEGRGVPQSEPRSGPCIYDCAMVPVKAELQLSDSGVTLRHGRVQHFCQVCWKQTAKPGAWASLQTKRTHSVPGKHLQSIYVEKRIDNRFVKCSTLLF